MRRIPFVAICFALACATFPCERAGAQVISLTTGRVEMPVVTIDPVTGAVQPLVNTNAPLVTGLSALDVTGRRLYFSNGGLGSQLLYIVNLQTQSVTSVPIPNLFPYGFFEFDPILGRILSISSAPGTPVVTIDPVTGVTQPLVNTNAPLFRGGISALDVTGRRLFFLSGFGDSQVVYTVNLQTLSVTSAPIPNPFAYAFFEFDPVLGRILSIKSTPGTPFVTIDPATGVVQALVNTNAPSFSRGISALDVTGRRVFFLSGFPGAQVLYSVNLQTLSVTGAPIPNPFSYAFFEFDPLVVAAAIPIGQSGLIALAFGLATIGWLMLRP